MVLLLGCGDARLSDTEAGVARVTAAESTCQPLGPGEALVGVSPEGEAWVEEEGGVRHVLPDGTSTPVDASFTRADALVAWDSRAAFVVGDNALWTTTSAGAEPLSLPAELGKPRFLCGDPQRAGGAFVITTRGLFERHDDSWLRWSFPIELLESMQIRDLEGACSAEDSTMYLEAGQSLWEVRHGEVASLREAADLTGLRTVGPDLRVGFVALRGGEPVRFDGAGWVPIPFDEGPVTEMSVADGVLWAAVDGTLYRRNRFDQWERLELSVLPTTVSMLRGYAAGGAWFVRAGQLCHVQTRETLRVTGVRPFGRLPQGARLLAQVSGEASTGSSLSVELEGQRIEVGGASGAWTITSPDELEPGWHTLRLAVASADGELRRTVKFLVEGAGTEEPPVPPPGEPTVYWETDIAPIYERSCALCHGDDGNQTFLGSFEAFSALGALSLERVSLGQMPPPGADPSAPPLSADEVELLRTWVEEGMNP